MQQVEKLDLNLLPNNVYGQISCSMQAKTNGGVKRLYNEQPMNSTPTVTAQTTMALQNF